MPIHLPPISRRTFLKSTLAAGASLAFGRSLFAAEVDPHRIAFLSDTHIDADPEKMTRMTNMTANLKAAAAEVAALPARPAYAIVNGDCAHLKGEPGDYENFVKLIEPIRETGAPMHVTLGNHDHRSNLWAGVKAATGEKRSLEDKHVSVLPMARANLFLLDSLDKVNATPGLLGDAQIDWLARVLDENKDKPAVIVGHHHMDDGARPGGIKDTKRLLEVLLPRKHVKAYIYGHTHTWNQKQHEDLHLINLPPVAYVFTAGHPSGWVQAQLQEDGIRLELSCLDKKHKAHGEVVNLKWRS